MKATGIIRRLDELGRVVLPIELRRQIEVDFKDEIEISVNGNEIRLTKYVPKCVFCKSEEEVLERLDRHICKKCIQEIG